MASEERWPRGTSDDVAADASQISDEQFHQLLDQYWAEQGFDIRRWVRASRSSSRSTPEPTREATASCILDLLDDVLPANDEDAAGGNGFGGATPASSMAMVSLPEMTVEDEKGEQGECPVCLQGFEEGHKLRKMPCVDSHCFHEQCIFNWLLISRHCPLCRFADHSMSARTVR
ncbi:hypothetical protein E2562_038250 [Oryza meyeriana var. granulata]|uniref:RING-type domain-containing protein n=1 Tax=Oryza meyeriana var. granulata TaxID=110450 RepID=A0A6G1BQW4_9ORYZ|nr:hypothetical protein E2562_038250 [Oryza meyeriana var. granulata]